MYFVIAPGDERSYDVTLQGKILWRHTAGQYFKNKDTCFLFIRKIKRILCVFIHYLVPSVSELWPKWPQVKNSVFSRSLTTLTNDIEENPK